MLRLRGSLAGMPGDVAHVRLGRLLGQGLRGRGRGRGRNALVAGAKRAGRVVCCCGRHVERAVRALLVEGGNGGRVEMRGGGL